MITIVVLLSVRDAGAFHQFERQASAIMETYGGRIDSAFRPDSADSEAAQYVDEIHVLKFPDHEAFDRYRSDGKLAALAALREKAIRRSSVYVSAIEVDYTAQN